MKQLSTLYLFVHPMPRKESTRKAYVAKWEKLIIDSGSRDDHVICFLSNAPKQMLDLIALAKEHFGERCIIDPCDDSMATKVLLAEDLDKTMRKRGNKTEWQPYEIWTSNNARRWTEGLKKSLDDLGFVYEGQHLNLVTCGQQWGGCLIKYSMFMAKYLGLSEPPDLSAELSPDAGFPFKAEYKERVKMDRHVYLYLFKMADGLPMAQYFDGLRAVWESPHIATVQLDASTVEIVNRAPSAHMKVRGAAEATGNTIIADVGDGCHPATTTLIGTKIGYEEFRESLINAKITPWNNSSSVQYMLGYQDPLTVSRGDE
jgi:hypothetical protein